ncbi:class I SAM-dependent methyltransferase [Candidatus Woesearchaeota archaeon]|nr:class I SAM-dependent methyltransferase [Candidatus Woesearchaeota archaeon]
MNKNNLETNKKMDVLILLERELVWLDLVFDDEYIKENCNLISVKNYKEFIKELSTKKFAVVVFCFPEFGFSKNKIKYLEILTKASKNNGAKYVLGLDLIIFANQYLMAGVDYFFQKDEFIHRHLKKQKYSSFQLFRHLLTNIILNKKPNQSIESLIIEKKEFYDSVKDIFDYRSTITANTRIELSLIKKYLDVWKAGVVLDGGCGNGRLTEPLAAMGFIITGIDINENLLKEARNKSKNKHNPKYLRMSLTNIDLPSNSFQAVILTWHVINEFKEYQVDVLKQIHKVLVSDGIFIFDFPDVGKNVQIDAEGNYEDEGTGLIKYRGLVLPVDRMLRLVESQGFLIADYKRVDFGGGKFFVVAIKR